MQSSFTAGADAGAPVEAIRLHIILRDIPAGAIVQEGALADSLGLSRTPIREALSVLAGEGVLAYERNRGYRTPLYAVQDMRDFFDAAGALYPAVFSTAARRRLGEDLAAMSKTLEAAAALDRLDDYRERVGLYRCFMLGVARASRNRFHLTAMRGLVDAHVMLRIDFASAADDETRRAEMHRNLAVYRQILDVIESGDAEAAATLARDRLKASREFIMGEILGE
mgnify:FL=1